MSFSLSFSRQRLFVALLVVATFSVLLITPHPAHAANVNITTATTTSSNASSTLAKVGDTLTIALQLSAAPAATNTPKINIWNMGTTSMTNTAGNYWYYSTTTSSTWPDGYVSWYVAWSGTLGEATTTFATSSLTSANVRFDKTSPTITSITSSASCTGTSGVCKTGDTITFTLTPGATEYGASVSGSYNGRSLSWSTSNGGATYVATYTVQGSDPSQGSPLQISGVIITDAAGNASAAGSGSDVTAPITTGGSGSGGSSSTTYYSNSSSGGSTASLATTTSSTTTPTTTTLTPAPLPTHALSATQVQSIVALLQSFGASDTVVANVTAALQGHPGAPAPGIAAVVSLTRNLSLGSQGAEVHALQVFLNTHGFMVASSGPGSSGNETTTFGKATRAALIQFQKANGIVPASGFLGPLTRHAIAGMQ